MPPTCPRTLQGQPTGAPTSHIPDDVDVGDGGLVPTSRPFPKHLHLAIQCHRWRGGHHPLGPLWSHFTVFTLTLPRLTSQLPSSADSSSTSSSPLSISFPLPLTALSTWPAARFIALRARRAWRSAAALPRLALAPFGVVVDG
eukprot:scaffold5178_cov107-Isochrysis_galbana.AAC.4